MTKLTLWNNSDLDKVTEGSMRPEDVRTAELDALVDTGATQLVLPIDVCRRLGLRAGRTVPVRLADGTDRQMTYYTSLHISILGRDMSCDALAAPEGTTPLIGQIPFEALGFGRRPEIPGAADQSSPSRWPSDVRLARGVALRPAG